MLWEILRELVILAAAAGVGLAAWQWNLGRSAREQASAAFQARRDAQALDLQRDLQAAMAGLDRRLEALSSSVSALAGRGLAEEQRWAGRIAIHTILQATHDPFLTFHEIDAALAGQPRAISGDALRRVLMEMVADGVIAQLDRDRYFVASDYEAGEGHDGAES